ncbi:MAG: TPR repeat protein [Nitrospira sp.]|jgi:tetratricopeptide (TPR) repeat protein|nr:TPR repeat protein [Nitrospira sp.]
MSLFHLFLWSMPWLGLLAIDLSTAAERHVSRVPLFDNLGTLHHPITTNSHEAQQYFDQGLRFVYAFNHEEAIMAFEEAARLDSSAAMAYWGVALASGPNINKPMDKAAERRAWDAVQKARTHRAHASAVEQAYIDAIGKRYDRNGHARPALDKAYADAMRVVWRQFPNDPDAGVLFAEALMDLHPWDLWTAAGRPKPGTEELVSTLESILARFPDHPGACHYYIHSVEASPAPDRALACAERLPALMPGAGHLVHMPAHIYMRLGRYHEAAKRNEHAADVDRNYLSGRKLGGDYADGYYTHNLHFLWASLIMEGRRTEALKVARRLTGTITEDEARKDKWKELYLPAPLWSMIRFGQWDELLREPPPPKTLRLQQGIWRLGRGMALSASGRLPGAEGEHLVLAGMAKGFGRDRTSEEKTERILLKIAERLLAGELAMQRRKYDEGIASFTDAVKLEEELSYTEPPLWPIPIRHYLGAALLRAGQPGKAEAVYRADLTKNPRNGWAQFGLMQSLRAQEKVREADDVEKQWQRAWEHADVTLTASRF